MAGRDLGVARQRADGGLSTRGACSMASHSSRESILRKTNDYASGQELQSELTQNIPDGQDKYRRNCNTVGGRDD